MLSFLLCLACTGNRFMQPPLVVETCDAWSDYLADHAVADRIVACHDRDLALQSDRSIAETHAHWTAVLSRAGLAPIEDDSRPPAIEGTTGMIAQTWGDPVPRLSLAISHDGLTHVSLAVVP